jgi:hypothetical protein
MNSNRRLLPSRTKRLHSNNRTVCISYEPDWTATNSALSRHPYHHLIEPMNLLWHEWLLATVGWVVEVGWG